MAFADLASVVRKGSSKAYKFVKGYASNERVKYTSLNLGHLRDLGFPEEALFHLRKFIEYLPEGIYIDFALRGVAAKIATLIKGTPLADVEVIDISDADSDDGEV